MQKDQAELMPVRQISPEDAAAFQRLRLRGLKECPEAFTSSHAEEVDTPLDVVSSRLLPTPDGSVWGYFDGASLVGMVGVHRERQRQVAHKAVIWGMYVASECRRRGIARDLMSHAVAYAADVLRVRSIKLGVNTNNKAALALYRSMGFETYGTEKGFLMVEGVLHDEHLMVRHVDGAQPAAPRRDA